MQPITHLSFNENDSYNDIFVTESYSGGKFKLYNFRLYQKYATRNTLQCF